jgi:hypothetical protein
MKYQNISNLFPVELSMHGISAHEKRAIVVSLIQGAIDEIDGENRAPTKWERCTIATAMAALLFERYSVAVHEVYLATKDASQVSEPQKWFMDEEEFGLDALQRTLEKLKGMA